MIQMLVIETSFRNPVRGQMKPVILKGRVLEESELCFLYYKKLDDAIISKLSR